MTDIKYRQRNLTPEQKVAIVTDYNAHMLVVDIIARHHIGRSTLYRVLKDMVQKEEQNVS